MERMKPDRVIHVASLLGLLPVQGDVCAWNMYLAFLKKK